MRLGLWLSFLLLPALAQVLTLPDLRARTYGEGGFRVERVLEERPAFTRVQFSYLSDGLRVHGFANLPKGRGPFPVVVVLHGYVEPSRYRLLAYTTPYADFLAERGYDPVFGARPLRRVIQRELETPLAQKILAGEVKEGDRVQVDVGPAGLVFAVPARVEA